MKSDMAKARVTVVVEYELNPDHYPGASSPSEMVALDRTNYEEDNVSAVDFVDMGELVSIDFDVSYGNFGVPEEKK